MQRLPFRPPEVRPALAALVLALCAPPQAALGDGPPLLVRIPDPAASNLVHRSLQGAIARLEGSEACRAVLEDFANEAGEPLATALKSRGETPGSYVAGLIHYDGSSHPRCRGGRVLAFTAPGWRVVYVCAAVFRRQLERDPLEAEAVLIHEALHTLGLGENPPTPRAIQDQVRSRCIAGRSHPPRAPRRSIAHAGR
jgi:hypothetical protein